MVLRKSMCNVGFKHQDYEQKELSLTFSLKGYRGTGKTRLSLQHITIVQGLTPGKDLLHPAIWGGVTDI
jgi:hypothetical protein